MDVRPILCGADGGADRVAVIDGCRREILGDELASRSRAKEAEHSLEKGCLQRLGTMGSSGRASLVSSHNRPIS